MTLSILIADDHEVVRRGLKSLLEAEPGWTVCGEAADGQEAIERVAALDPDLVIMDITMPGLDGLEATREICRAGRRAQVVMLSVHDSEKVMREALAAGARGFVLKSDAGRDLVAALQAVREGKTFLSGRVTDVVLSAFMKGSGTDLPAVAAPPARDPAEREPPRTPLTQREQEVLRLLAEGRSTKEVASALGIGIKTAETHRSHVMSKLGLRSVADLVRYAIKHGLVRA